MGFENNIEMLSLAFWTVLKLAGPVLVVALVIGLIIGIIQAATSINEMTLSFVPKVIIVILTIAIFSNYLILGLTDYFMFIFERVAATPWEFEAMEKALKYLFDAKDNLHNHFRSK